MSTRKGRRETGLPRGSSARTPASLRDPRPGAYPVIDVVDALAASSGAQPVRALALSPDATMLATGFAGYLPCVALWDVASGRLLRKLMLGLHEEFPDLHERDDVEELVADHEESLVDFFHVQQLGFRADGKQLAVISGNHDNGNQLATRLEVFDVKRGRVTLHWSLGTDEAWAEVVGPASFAWDPASSDLVAATFQGDVLRWRKGGRCKELRPGRRGEDAQTMVDVHALAVRGDCVVWWADDRLETIGGRKAWQVAVAAGRDPRRQVMSSVDVDGVFTCVELQEKRGRVLRFDGALRDHVFSGISWLASLSGDGAEVVWGDSQAQLLRWRSTDAPAQSKNIGPAERAVVAAHAADLLALSDGRRVWFSTVDVGE